MSLLLENTARGVYVIAATPFNESGNIDWASVDSLIEFYLGKGVDGMTILGMMGEAQKLSESESIELTEYILAYVAGRIPVVVGVSNGGTKNLVNLSERAMSAGACGVMVAPIGSIKTETQAASYIKDVCEALGPGVPVVYQDFPQMTGVHVSADALVRMIDASPNIVMVKHEDCPGMRKLSQLKKACDGSARRKISVLVGNGAVYLPQELRRGADGAMTGFAYPEMLVDVCSLARSGQFDQAEDLFDLYLPLVRHEQQPGLGLAIRKEILRRRGAIRFSTSRAPGPKLDADDLRELDGLMTRLEANLEARSWTVTLNANEKAHGVKALG